MAVMKVGDLKKQIADMDDEAIVVLDHSKASCAPVHRPVTVINGRELQDGRFRLGGGGISLAVITAG